MSQRYNLDTRSFVIVVLGQKMKRALRGVLIALPLLLACNVLRAQSSLALSSGTGPTGSPISLDLTLTSSSATQPAGLQWTFNYPAASVIGFAVSGGPVLNAAGKTLNCTGSSAGYTCIATGVNTNPIPDGVVATVSITLAVAATVPVGVSGAVVVALDGSQIGTSTTDGTATSITPLLLSGLSCTPPSLGPGAVAVCTVTMSGPVAAVTTVALSATAGIAVPASVSIASNTFSATFNATPGSFSANQSATVTAALNGITVTANLSLVAPITVASLQCAGTTLPSSGTMTCTVTLSNAAPTGGASVALSSSATSAVTVPASVSVAAGATTAAFTATALAVTTNQTATLTAALNGSTAPITLTVTAAPVTVTSLTCASTSVPASGNTTCTVTLSSVAPAGGTGVALSSSATGAVTVPTSVSVAAAATTAAFTATALAVTSNQTAIVTAALNGSTVPITLTVTAAPVTVTSLTCASTSLPASGNTTCTVTLSSVAPAGGASVALSSSATGAVTVPASVSVAAAATTAAFIATAAAVTSNQTATITAALNGSTMPFTITVTAAPITVTSLQCASTNLSSSGTTTCTVTLSNGAPAGGASVALSSSATSVLTVPASVSVAAAATTATFIATAAAVVSNQTATITAALNGSTVPITLTVTAPLVTVTSLTCASTNLSSSGTTTCTVTLSNGAPTGGTSVALSSSATSVLTVPVSVSVVAAATTATFTATAAAVASNQTATITASLGASSAAVTLSVAAPLTPSSLAQLACSLLPSQAGTCNVTLTAASPSASDVALRSTNLGVKLPVSVTVPAGSLSAAFGFTLTSNVTGWAIISATLGTVTRSVTISAGVSQGGGSASLDSSALRLRCDRGQIAAGESAVCEILYKPGDSADAIDFSVSSTSQRVKTAASVRGRAGRSAVRFEVSADEEASQESVTIQANAGSAHAEASLLVLSSGSLHLRVPHSATATPGSPVRFIATVADDQGLPVSVVAAGMPGGAGFDRVSGLWEWTPGDGDLGAAEISFTARNSLDQTVTKTVAIHVVPSQPVLTGLRNGVGSGALAACSPGSLATLVGTSLSGITGTEEVSVLVNGSEASVIRASGGQVHFLCPGFAPGTPMAIAVRVGGHASNELRTVMQQTAPGLFSTDGTGTGQGMVAHALGLAALPRFERAGTPAAAGDAITLFATGIKCDDTSGAPKPLLYFGHTPQRIALLRPRPLDGVCEIHSVVPRGQSGDGVEVFLESIRDDGSALRSNTLLIAVE